MADPPAVEALVATPVDASTLLVESTGHIYVAPVGTAFPTAFAVPTSPWIDVGHTSTDGPRPTGWERDSDRKFTWQSPNVPVRSVLQPAEPQFLVDLLQVTGQTLQLFFGGGTVTPGTAPAPTVFVPPQTDPVEQALVIDAFDGARQMRWCVKRTMPIAGGDVTLESNEMAVWPVRFDVLAATDGSVWGEIRYPAAA